MALVESVIFQSWLWRSNPDAADRRRGALFKPKESNVADCQGCTALFIHPGDYSALSLLSLHHGFSRISMSSSRLDSQAIPPTVRRVAAAFRLSGWASFWSQVVLAVISAIVLLFAAANLNTPITQPQVVPGAIPTAVVPPNPGTGAGSFLALVALVALLIGIFWAFRYVLLSRQLTTGDAQRRPKRADVIQSLRIGILVSLVGMVVSLLGTFATVGSLVGRSFTLNLTLGSLQSIRPIDIIVVQANINLVLAHFIALVASLWLLQSVNRQ